MIHEDTIIPSSTGIQMIFNSFLCSGIVMPIKQEFGIEVSCNEMYKKGSYKQLCRADFSAGLHLLHL